MPKSRPPKFAVGACVVLVRIPMNVAQTFSRLTAGTQGQIVLRATATSYLVRFPYRMRDGWLSDAPFTIDKSYLKPCPRRQVEIE